ncbi:hypothetical protein QR680_006636 [Steinernema hermaphroditum]|uniref:NTR domain-containing protein n=1 Tax=Steinernema hermaphroditum TaxID=289476 RepID=A0AA39LXR5_9BILA|nr:hypothetical protein QR680_006636 [Steinernema hermaphroditum]
MYRTFLYFFTLLAITCGCTCGPEPPSPQENFCQSDFVGVVEIVSTKRPASEEDPHPLVYTAKANNPHLIFKAPKNFNISQNIVFETYSETYMCNVGWLKDGRTYLLNGRVHENTIFLNRCFQVAANEWYRVPAHIRNALKDGSYARNCPKKL